MESIDILKIAVEWAKDEVFSSRFFIFFALLFLAGSLGFWQFGKTEMAKAYTIPCLVAGALLLAVGVGIYFANKSRVNSFAEAYEQDASEFIRSEITRTEQSIGEYSLIVFKVIPIIIVVCALLILFVDKPVWRAACITTIAMMLVILIVDSNAKARIDNYRANLVQVIIS